MLKIEFEEPNFSTCECCGGKTTQLTRFVYQDDYAIYYLKFSNNHSDKTISCSEKVGIDGGKLIKGRKRFYFVDTMGNLLDSFVESANSYVGTTAIKYWGSMSSQNILLDNIDKMYADGTFGGTFSEHMQKNME